MDQRENLFQHFLGELPSTSGTPHPCDDADAEEVCDEPEYDPASESEEDVMSENDDELVEEDDEDVDLTTLQPVDGSFLIDQASEGSARATASQESDAMPNETPGEETNGCEALLSTNQDRDTGNGSLVTPNDEDIHGLFTAKDGTVWSKTAPPPTRTSASNIFRPPPKQVVNSRSLFSEDKEKTCTLKRSGDGATFAHGRKTTKPCKDAPLATTLFARVMSRSKSFVTNANTTEGSFYRLGAGPGASSGVHRSKFL
ncbi:hypothetical protein RRG08_055177 [Elysia crispata]|uniref:Uncharacterized protein n=1 Tax=Elysia crispata TaxID=231223 RepID=A0AAE1A5F9_9GAST|nr:hypothetical protein RRG08_055177 [Elysia crispata]